MWHCAICLEAECKTDDRQTLDCGHCFHKSCMARWESRCSRAIRISVSWTHALLLRSPPTCPMCRQVTRIAQGGEQLCVPLIPLQVCRDSAIFMSAGLLFRSCRTGSFFWLPHVLTSLYGMLMMHLPSMVACILLCAASCALAVCRWWCAPPMTPGPDGFVLGLFALILPTAVVAHTLQRVLRFVQEDGAPVRVT